MRRGAWEVGRYHPDMAKKKAKKAAKKKKR